MPAFVPYDERVEIALELSFWSCVLSKNELINVHCELQANIYNQVYKSKLMEVNKMAKKDRFEKVYSQGTVNVMEIWVDKETGVNYVFHASGYSGGMAPLLDRDGKPVISPIMNSYVGMQEEKEL